MSTSSNEPPQDPAGPFRAETNYGEDRKQYFISTIEEAPLKLRGLVDGLTRVQLNTPYRNWSIRQIVHHLADSHVHSYIRFKWTLTEEQTTIKAYDEGAWALLEDSLTGPIDAPLALLEGLHKCWVQLLRMMTNEQYGRSFHHPESGKTVPLSEALCYYAWHCRHHTAQTEWLVDKHGWPLPIS